jgi:hypothetical protein
MTAIARAKTKRPEADIRTVFHALSDEALLDDLQIALIADVSRPTIKRWRREKIGPRVTMLNGLPRSRVGDVREWLKAGRGKEEVNGLIGNLRTRKKSTPKFADEEQSNKCPST